MLMYEHACTETKCNTAKYKQCIHEYVCLEEIIDCLLYICTKLSSKPKKFLYRLLRNLLIWKNRKLLMYRWSSNIHV